MAEINIERKERSALPWLLAGIVLLALLWFLFARNNNGAVATGTAGDSTYRDSSTAAGTLGQPATAADSARADSARADSLRTIPPR